MKKNIFIILTLFCTACAEQKQETFAHITQRRVDTDGRLVISYQFNAGEKIIYDSVEVTNKVVPHDSVKVVFSPEHPEESRLLLP